MSPARIGLLLAVVVFLLASSVRGQPGAPVEDGFREVLGKALLVSFRDQPLDQVAAEIARTYEIPVVVDRRGIAESGFDSSVRVSLDVSGLSLRSSLDLMLRPLDLAWTVFGDVLYITSGDNEEGMLITRVYNVRDLVLPAGGIALADPMFESDFYSLIELITTTLVPNSWDSVGGLASICEFELDGVCALVIAQTYRHHERIERLLAELRGVVHTPQSTIARSREVAARPRVAVPRRYAPSPSWARPHMHE